MTAADDAYAEVLRRVVAGFAPVVVGDDPRLTQMRPAATAHAVVAAGTGALPDAWSRSCDLGLATVYVVVPASGRDVRASTRAMLAGLGWVLLGMSRVMWPAGDAQPAPRRERIDRDTREVVAQVVPAGADAVEALAQASTAP